MEYEQVKTGKFTEFYWTAPNIEFKRILDTSYSNDPYFKTNSLQSRFLNQFIFNELGFKQKVSGEKSKHIEYMQRHELVDYCDVSEKGHMKWYPKGMLMRNLMLQYAKELALDWGAFEMDNPILIKGDNNEVGKLMGEFHERDYKVDGGRGIGFLRYASDPLGFPFMQNVKYSQEHPLKVYESAYCFRNEQDGEVSGLKRMRWFIMTDMHGIYQTNSEAKQEFEYLTGQFATLMNDTISKNRWVLGWELSADHFNKEKDWLKSISDKIKVPSFFKIMPEMTHYYAFKNEFQSITADGANIQVSTVQWDVKNAERFNIGPTDDKGKKRSAEIILHASSFGSIERALCSILENIAIDEQEGKVPEYPLWLAPTQIRLANVEGNHLPKATELSNYFESNKIRSDIDDRNHSVGKKVKNSERDWVPYILVVGDKELSSDVLSVRIRNEKRNEEMSKESLVNLIRSQTEMLPYERLSLPKLLSKRPSFK